MQFLTTKRQAEGLSSKEQAEVEHLLQRYDHVMLVRAQAMALLRKRGFDLSTLLSPLLLDEQALYPNDIAQSGRGTFSIPMLLL